MSTGPEIEVGTFLYRAEVEWCSWYSSSIGYRVAVVVKVTPKGFWIEPPPPPSPYKREADLDIVSAVGRIDTDRPRRWYSFNTYRWSTTREEALGHLVARKQAHVRHAERRLKQAKLALAAAQDAVVEEAVPEPKLRLARWNWYDDWP